LVTTAAAFEPASEAMVFSVVPLRSRVPLTTKPAARGSAGANEIACTVVFAAMVTDDPR